MIIRVFDRLCSRLCEYNRMTSFRNTEMKLFGYIYYLRNSVPKELLKKQQIIMNNCSIIMKFKFYNIIDIFQ